MNSMADKVHVITKDALQVKLGQQRGNMGFNEIQKGAGLMVLKIRKHA